MSSEESSAFAQFIRECVARRKWSIAETARRASVTQPELSRILSGSRNPTLRHVRGLAQAFYTAPSAEPAGEPTTIGGWWERIGELACVARRERDAARRES